MSTERSKIVQKLKTIKTLSKSPPQRGIHKVSSKDAGTLKAQKSIVQEKNSSRLLRGMSSERDNEQYSSIQNPESDHNMTQINEVPKNSDIGGNGIKQGGALPPRGSSYEGKQASMREKKEEQRAEKGKLVNQLSLHQKNNMDNNQKNSRNKGQSRQEILQNQSSVATIKTNVTNRTHKAQEDEEQLLEDTNAGRSTREDITKTYETLQPNQIEQQPSTLADFQIIQKIGDGAYSNVFKVKRLADGQLYALKKVKLEHLSEKEQQNAINEVRILASINHPNVIQYKEAFVDAQSKSLCIVMELADNGDVFQKICNHKKQKTYIKERQIWQIFVQVVWGLSTMHRINIMHRDLKSANLFLYNDLKAKLGDMNVSKVTNSKGLNYTQTGTPYYASPEVWSDEPYDSKSDIWSLGCVIYEMVTLKPPFQADDMQGLYKKVIKGVLPKIPDHFSSDIWNMLRLMIQTNPKKRPTCQELMDHEIFKKRSNKYFPEYDQQGYLPDQIDTGQSFLLKTIRIPKNIMHLSSRLPKKNYQSVLYAQLKQQREFSGQTNSFRNQQQFHCNTMGQKVNNSKAPQQPIQNQQVQLHNIRISQQAYQNSVQHKQGGPLMNVQNVRQIINYQQQQQQQQQQQLQQHGAQGQYINQQLNRGGQVGVILPNLPNNQLVNSPTRDINNRRISKKGQINDSLGHIQVDSIKNNEESLTRRQQVILSNNQSQLVVQNQKAAGNKNNLYQQNVPPRMNNHSSLQTLEGINQQSLLPQQQINGLGVPMIPKSKQQANMSMVYNSGTSSLSQHSGVINTIQINPQYQQQMIHHKNQQYTIIDQNGQLILTPAPPIPPIQSARNSEAISSSQMPQLNYSVLNHEIQNNDYVNQQYVGKLDDINNQNQNLQEIANQLSQKRIQKQKNYSLNKISNERDHQRGGRQRNNSKLSPKRKQDLGLIPQKNNGLYGKLADMDTAESNANHYSQHKGSINQSHSALSHNISNSGVVSNQQYLSNQALIMAQKSQKTLASSQSRQGNHQITSTMTPTSLNLVSKKNSQSIQGYSKRIHQHHQNNLQQVNSNLQLPSDVQFQMGLQPKGNASTLLPGTAQSINDCLDQSIDEKMGKASYLNDHTINNSNLMPSIGSQQSNGQYTHILPRNTQFLQDQQSTNTINSVGLVSQSYVNQDYDYVAAGLKQNHQKLGKILISSKLSKKNGMIAGVAPTDKLPSQRIANRYNNKSPHQLVSLDHLAQGSIQSVRQPNAMPQHSPNIKIYGSLKINNQLHKSTSRNRAGVDQIYNNSKDGVNMHVRSGSSNKIHVSNSKHNNLQLVGKQQTQMKYQSQGLGDSQESTNGKKKVITEGSPVNNVNKSLGPVVEEYGKVQQSKMQVMNSNQIAQENGKNFMNIQQRQAQRNQKFKTKNLSKNQDSSRDNSLSPQQLNMGDQANHHVSRQRKSAVLPTLGIQGDTHEKQTSKIFN